MVITSATRNRVVQFRTRGFESLTLRQERSRLNQRSDTVAFFISSLNYLFVNGNAGVVFNYTRPEMTNTHWKTQPRNEHGDFIKKQ